MRLHVDRRVALLICVPLATQAAALAPNAGAAETPLEAAMPRILVATATLLCAAWLASTFDNERGGIWTKVAGVAMAGMTVGAVSFGASLAAAMLVGGQTDLMAICTAAFIALFMTMTAAILCYVVSVTTGIGAKSVAFCLAADCAVVTVLIVHPQHVAAAVVAGFAATAALAAAFWRRSDTQNRP